MKLLITRGLKQSERLSERLTREGNEVFCLPLIEIVPPADGGAALQSAVTRLAEYDWLILTSQNTVWAVEPLIRTWPASLEIAAAGPKTAAELKKLGKVAFYPEKNFGAEGLIEFFQQQNISGKKILYPRSSLGREELVEALQALGASVEVIEAYQTRPSSVTAHDIFGLIHQGVKSVLFFSPSQVARFFELIRPNDERIRHLEWIPIGPTTSRALAVSLREAAGGGEAI